MRKLSNETILHLYKNMLLVRVFEQKLEEEHKRGHVPGLLHTGVGQEATLAAIAFALEKTDCFFPDHRSHGLCLLAGSPGEKLMAEILGKASGVCGGRGGSMHLADPTGGNYGGNVVEGSMMATVLGPALAWKMRGEARVSAVVIGDGTTGRGEFNESLNLASIWNLPVFYCLINNQYAISTHVTEAHPTAHLSELTAGYKIKTAQVDGNDFIAATQAALDAVDYIRAGNGPFFLEFHTYRWAGIFSGEMRDPEEVRMWKIDREPIRRGRQVIIDQQIANEAELDNIEADVKKQVAEWLDYAHESAQPDPSTALDYVYSNQEVWERWEEKQQFKR
ncbi:MAG: thiamine pyrophosphate-dependent dehydrogenase E1 component subunit alpha [Chloroflexi bacterium]|nr:MAG: thiamine pyrophosphate-dependent dehydrogenase E1 component subunit alpha [Chloroflexota bacterium]